LAPTQPSTSIWIEIADLITSGPTLEQMIQFRPSEPIQQRVRHLLAKLKNGLTTAEDDRELNQFENAEMLMQLVKAKARLRLAKVTSAEIKEA